MADTKTVIVAGSTADILSKFAKLPWWANIIMAALVYMVVAFWMPDYIFSENPLRDNKGFRLVTGIDNLFNNIAIALAAIFLIIALVSASRQFNKKIELENDSKQ